MRRQVTGAGRRLSLCRRLLHRRLRLRRERGIGDTDVPSPRLLRQMARAIRKLPNGQREVFCAIRFEDASYAEIAERLDLSVSEVERLFAKALVGFMRNLDRQQERWWRRWW
jgi:RNA polymerase sigma-70 factor (ECF subfamily)